MTISFINFPWSWSVVVLMLTALAYGGPAIPVFKNIDNSTILYVREDAELNFTIITLSATDLDDDNMTFLVVSDGGGPFGLDFLSQTRAYRTATIKLNIINKTPGLDYERKISYTPVVLSVSDGARSTNVSIMIRVVDVNDNSPILNLTSPVVTIGEDTAVGTRLPYLFSTIERDRIDTDFVSLTGNDSTMFNIEPMTGRIYLNTKVDVDPATPFLVFKPILVVSDGTFTDSGTITLTVLDVNDNSPSCDPTLAYVTVDEETTGSPSILSLNCSDRDSSLNNNNVLRYSLAPGNADNYSVDSFGLVSRRVPGDYETSSSETVLIRVQDGGVNTSLSTTVTVIVLIAPINDNIPIWSLWIPPLPANNTYTIREDVPVGTQLFAVRAADADLDVGNTLSYNMTSGSDGLLRLDSKTGQVILKKKLNVDGVNGISTYKIVCEASDGGGVTHTISREVTLNISDVNDNAPMFLGTPYSNIVIHEENAKTGFILTSVVASDEDLTPSVLTYSVDAVIMGDINESYLNFSNVNLGHLEWIQDLDLDKGGQISTLTVIKILVKDNGTPQLTGTATLTISIMPDNEYTPVIRSEPGTSVVEIAENQVPGTVVVRIVAEDEDRGDEGLLQYSIIAGNEDRHFLITSDGTLKTQSVLNRETSTLYRLVVNISDSGLENIRSVTTTVTVSVTDVNDNAPTCSDEVLFLQAPEDTTVNMPLHTFNCSDADSGDKLRFVVRPPHNNIFGFKTPSQDLILLSAFDFESKFQHYDIDVIISDGTYNNTVKVKIAVLPVNEDTPQFTTNPQIIVPENSLSSNLITYTALDTDFSPHNIESYEITSVSKQGSPYFGIDTKSGRIYLYSYLDFDSLPTLDKSYEIVVVAQDGGGLKGTGTVTVLVSNVNDNSPVCNQSTFLVRIPQNQNSIPCSIFTSLGCTDAEDGSALVYSLNQTQEPHFNCTDDAIQLSNYSLDYEISEAHTLLVGVADKGHPPLTSTVVLIVNVINKNNGGPVFKLREVVTINETAKVGQFVADVVAIDPDGNDPYFGDINYKIIAGDPFGQFYIHLKSGQITIRKRLDFEINSFYNLVIQARENLGANSATVTQVVNISDINDEAPVCSPYLVLETVEENKPANYLAANLSCFDADVGTNLAYSITYGDTSLFMLDENKLMLKAPLDYEKSTIHDLLIQVSDLDPNHNTEIYVTVLVGSVNEGPPVFDKSIYYVSIEENQPIISVVTTIEAIDPDFGADQNGLVSYSLLTNSTQFVLDGSSGQLFTKDILDREKIQMHSLIVRASDNQGYNTASVLISVLDVNDNKPIFTQDLYSAFISEGDAPGTTLTTMSATDADDPDTKGFGRITYTLSPNSLFLINSTTGVITNRGTVTQEDMGPSLYLTVTATDSYGQSGSLTSTTNVVINLITVNQYAPVFDQSTYTIFIKENQLPVGGLILNVTAHDNDTGLDGDMTLKIVGNQTKFFLTQTKNIGEIRLGENMDFDNGDTGFTFQVKATDHGDTPKSSSCQIEVTILNENDNPPMCPSFILVNKQEGEVNIAALNCTDADFGSLLNYSILSLTSINRLRQIQPMVSSTGILTVLDPLDFENSPDLEILVKVTDDGLPTQSATVTVSVHVLDINEHSPTFTGNLTFTLREDAPLDGRVLYRVLATGNDGPDDALTFWILDTSYFYISPVKGEIILVTKAPDYETVGDIYRLGVCVKDKPNPSELTACGTIMVKLIDVNDERPTFSSTISILALGEDAAIGTRITGDSAVDKDKSSVYNSILYSIQLGNTEDCFRILPNGDLEVTKSLDYERTQSYSLTIQASDGFYNATVIYNVQITSVNEFVPTFSNSSVTLSIPENSRPGNPVYLAEATDFDLGDDGVMKYSIETGLFSINPMSGAVTVAGNLDRETTPSYTVVVLAVDMGTPPRTGSQSLTIDVTDMNDNVPTCSSNPYFVSVPENISSGEIVTKLICHDDDDDPDNLNNKLSYNIVSTNTSEFRINESGEITVIGSLDYEGQDLYTVVVQISDQSPVLQLTTSVTVSLTVLDVNDNTPHFTYLASTSVPEDLPVGTKVIIVRASDEDSGVNKELLYQINGATASGKFSIEPVHGNIVLEKSLDYEMQKFHQIVVTVRDNGVPPRSVTGTVTVTVTDVNDSPPVCNASVVTVRLPENSLQMLVASVSCTDADSTDTVTYNITEGNDNSFVIDSNTGVITLAQPASLDFETTPLYMLRVSASDGIHIQDVFVKVIVTDVNEYRPDFNPNGPISKMVTEDLSIHEIIYEFNATDRDTSDTVKIYTILNGNSENMFLLDSASGKLSVESPFRFEDKSAYYLTIQVADSGNLTAEQNLTIFVKDTNNNDPSCTSKYVRLSVREGVSNKTLYTPSCSDKDKVASPFLEYYLKEPSWQLDINKTTGEIGLREPFDYENASRLDFQLIVQESPVPNPRSTVLMISIHVEPVNEHSPVFQPSSTYGSYNISEDAPTGTLITQVLATDVDKGLSQGLVRYYIIGGDPLLQFDVDELTGAITLIQSLDYETKTNYSLTMRAEDDTPGSNTSKSATATVRITVVDVNDHIPTLVPVLYQIELPESFSHQPARIVRRLVVVDADDGLNGVVNITISAGNTRNKFDISGANLMLLDQLDYEDTTSYELILDIKDSGSPPLESSGRIVIRVLPINEQAPLMNKSSDSLTLPEDTYAGTLVYKVEATDSDRGRDGEITFTMANNSSGSFILDPASGELFVATELDYDVAPNTMTITIKATDGGGLSDAKTSVLSLTIRLQDTNDNPPLFASSLYKMAVDENVPLGTIIGSVKAVDKDSGIFGQVYYRILGNAGQKLFDLDNTKGVIKTADSIDYENFKEYYMFVTAYDGGRPALTSDTLVKVQVLNKNDNDPVISPSDLVITISELTPSGATILTYLASDKDTNITGFYLVETTQNFEVVASTGEVKTLTSLDREIVKEFVLHIKVLDQATTSDTTTRTSTATLTIFLDDSNDNSPVIYGTYNKSVPENIHINELIFTITATDADEPDNTSLIFSIVGGNTENAFYIDSNGHLQVRKSLDRESVAHYNLKIRVTDHGIPARSSETKAVIYVADVNDNTPVFQRTYYAFHVPENSFVGTEVGAINASDTDEGPNAELTYTFDSFSSGQMSHFIIDPDSGAITVASSDLDREKLSSYKAKIKVSDAGQPFYKSSFVEAVINIDDVNDNYPVFTRANYTIAMEEKTEIDTTLLVVVASDMDSDKNADVSYIMDPGMMDGSVAKTYFQVNTSSGVVSTKNIVPYENYQSFIFLIYAVDHGLPPLTGTTTLTIKILDINDNYPVFSPTFYNSEMAYNSQCEKIITQVTATDEDFGQNAAVSYFLQDETSQFLFQVDLLTGELGPVNIAPQHARFVLGVLARDAGTPIRSSKVPATVRVDTFNPDLYVITFRLAISRTAFFARVETFLNKLQHVVQTKFPSAIVRLWCVVEYDGVAQTTSGSRRRLLADQSVDVHLYALRDNTTDSAGNINKEKDFLKQDEFLSVVSANPQGDPGSNIQGDEWDYFGIVNVTPYHEEPKGWFDTDYGKAITAVAILLGLVLLAFWSYFLLICCSACVRRWKKRKSLAKKESEEKEFKERPKNEKFSLWQSGESVAAVSNSDDSEIHKKSVLPSYDGANEMNDTSKERNPSKPTHSQTDHDPAFSKSQHNSLLAYDFKKPVINLKKVKSETESDLSSWKWTIPRLMVVRKNSSDLSNSEDQSTSFEGKAHDRVSGKVYEYNTKTNQREWVN